MPKAKDEKQMGNQQPIPYVFSRLKKVGKLKLKEGKYLFNEHQEKVYNTESKKYLKVSDNGNGYLYMTLTDEDGKHKRISQHRVNASTKGDITGKVVHHLDHDTTNNTRDNLMITDQKTNIKFSVDAGRRVVNNMKLDESEVHEICSKLEEGLTSKAIVENLDTDISIACIDKIRSRKLWTKISKEYNIPEVKKVINHNWAEHQEYIDAHILKGGVMREVINEIFPDIDNRGYQAFFKYYKRRETAVGRGSTTIETF